MSRVGNKSIPLPAKVTIENKDYDKALESYKKAWDEKNGVWRDKPLHDWSSHGADAFRMFAVHERQPKPVTRLRRKMRMGF